MIKNMQMDFGVIGEGEETIVELIRAIESQRDFSRINGIIFKNKKGDIVRTPRRKAVEPLDNLPFPDYEGFEVEKYLDSLRPNDSIHLTFMDKPRTMTLISSRSCPFNCTFCFHPTGNKYRQRSLDSFFKELEYFVKTYKLNIIEIMDELFARDTKRINEFCDRIKPFNLIWYAHIRADAEINHDTLSLLKNSGNYMLNCGVESASDTILKSMKKHTTVAMIEHVLPMIKTAGIIPVSNFILGDPAETAETVRETMNWWRNHSDYDFLIAPITPYPGTEIYRYSLENNIITDKLEFLEKGCPPVNMSRELGNFEYQRIFYEGYEIRVAHRKFARIISVEQEGFDPIKRTFLYSIELSCPHCNKNMIYKHFHVKEIRTMDILCRSCGRAIGLVPTIFDHIKKEIIKYRERLFDLSKKRRPVTVVPAVYTPNFLQYLKNIIEVDVNQLNIKYFLDENPKPGMVADEYSILAATKENIEEKCRGHLFMIMPFDSSRETAMILKQKFGVSEDDMVYLQL